MRRQRFLRIWAFGALDVRYLPSGIFGRPPIYDVCCEAPSLSCDPQSFSGPAYRSFIAVVGKVRGATFNHQTSVGFNARPPKANPRRLSRQGRVTSCTTIG